jgi:hypothetical protein
MRQQDTGSRTELEKEKEARYRRKVHDSFTPPAQPAFGSLALTPNGSPFSASTYTTTVSPG